MYVLTIECAHLGELAARAGLHPDIESEPTLSFVRLRSTASKSWNMGLIGRGTVHMAGVPTTVGNGPADHAYEVVTSAEGLRAGLDGRAQSCGKRRFIEFPCAKKS